MDYNPEPGDDESVKEEQKMKTYSDSVQDVFVPWIEKWQTVADEIDTGYNHLQGGREEQRDDLVEAMYEDAAEAVSDTELTVDDIETSLVLYNDEPDAISVSGYFVSAVINQCEEEKKRFSPPVDHQVSGIGYGLPQGNVLTLDTLAQYVGEGSDGVIINDGRMKYWHGTGGSIINRGVSVDGRFFTGSDVINTGAAQDESFIGASQIIDFTEEEWSCIYPEFVEFNPDTCILQPDHQYEPANLVDIAEQENPDQVRDDLEALEKGITGDSVDIETAINQWNDKYPRWSIDGL